MFYATHLFFFALLATFDGSSCQDATANFKHGYPEMNIQAPKDSSVKTDTFTTRIDHFSFLNQDLFNMRYAYNKDFYKPDINGPMFVLIGGESSMDVTLDYLQAGLMYDMAQEMGAYMFLLEHRYYGESVPNLNLKTSNMRQLDIKQILADISEFIQDRQNSIPSLAGAQVVVFGGSYAGNLATWMRLKYPNVVDAAVSSSAPLKAKVNFLEYLAVFQSSLNNTNCTDIIKNATEEVQSKIQTNTGLEEVQKDFNLCAPLNFDDPQEVRHLFWSITLPFVNWVQYGTVTRNQELCSFLLGNDKGSPYQQVAYFVSSSNTPCLPSYATMIGELKSTDSSGTNRAWFYQMCSQLGYFTTTDSKDQPFLKTIPLGYFRKLCSDVYAKPFSGMMTDAGVAMTNIVYQGKSPNVLYVVSTQGSLDPWKALGPSEDLSQFAPVIIIDGASHCQDLQANQTTDPQSLKDARKQIKQYISSWIS